MKAVTHAELLDNELASTDTPNKGKGFLPTFVKAQTSLMPILFVHSAVRYVLLQI